MDYKGLLSCQWQRLRGYLLTFIVHPVVEFGMTWPSISANIWTAQRFAVSSFFLLRAFFVLRGFVRRVFTSTDNITRRDCRCIASKVSGNTAVINGFNQLRYWDVFPFSREHWWSGQRDDILRIKAEFSVGINPLETPHPFTTIKYVAVRNLVANILGIWLPWLSRRTRWNSWCRAIEKIWIRHTV